MAQALQQAVAVGGSADPGTNRDVGLDRVAKMRSLDTPTWVHCQGVQKEEHRLGVDAAGRRHSLRKILLEAAA
jgi:hypothetical protein